MKYLLTILVITALAGFAGCGSDSEQASDTAATEAKSATTAETAGGEHEGSVPDMHTATPDLIYNASDLIAEFSGKKVPEIDPKFLDKVIEVAGTLCYIDQVTYADGVTHGAVYVSLCPSSTYQRANVRCQFPENDTSYVFGGLPDRLLIINGVDTLARGHEVVVRGRYITLGALDFRMEDCQIVSY